MDKATDEWVSQVYLDGAAFFEATAEDLRRRAAALEHVASIHRQAAQHHRAQAEALREQAAQFATDGHVVELHMAAPARRGSLHEGSWPDRTLQAMTADPEREWSAQSVLDACVGPTPFDLDMRRLWGPRTALRRLHERGQIERTGRGRYRLRSEAWPAPIAEPTPDGALG